MKRYAGAVIAGATAFAVGAIWWWALFGMPQDVGFAVAATVAVLVLAALAGMEEL